MDKIFHLSIVWSSLIICKFQAYTDSTPYPKLSLGIRSEEHTSELQSPITISYAVFCLKKSCQDIL